MPQRELWRKNTEKWMKKYDRTSYEIWKDLLKPRLGKSLAKTESAIKHLRRFNSQRRFAPHLDPAVRVVVRCMRNPRSQYRAGTYLEANITLGFLHRLALNHRRRILRQRAHSAV